MNQWTIPAIILYILIFGSYAGYIVYHMVRGGIRGRRTRAEFGTRPEDSVKAVPIGLPVRDASYRRVRFGLIAFLGIFMALLVLSAYDNRDDVNQFLIDASLAILCVASVTFVLTVRPKAPVVILPEGIYGRKGLLGGGDTLVKWREVKRVALDLEGGRFIVTGPEDTLPELGPGEVTDDWEGIFVSLSWPDAGQFADMALKMVPENRWSKEALETAQSLARV